MTVLRSKIIEETLTAEMKETKFRLDVLAKRDGVKYRAARANYVEALRRFNDFVIHKLVPIDLKS